MSFIRLEAAGGGSDLVCPGCRRPYDVRWNTEYGDPLIGEHLVKCPACRTPIEFGCYTEYKQSDRPREPEVPSVSWSAGWPDAPGPWWFYGWPFGNKTRAPQCLLLQASRNAAGGIIVIGDGHFWFESEGPAGMFARAELPRPPDGLK